MPPRSPKRILKTRPRWGVSMGRKLVVVMGICYARSCVQGLGVLGWARGPPDRLVFQTSLAFTFRAKSPDRSGDVRWADPEAFGREPPNKLLGTVLNPIQGVHACQRVRKHCGPPNFREVCLGEASGVPFLTRNWCTNGLRHIRRSHVDYFRGGLPASRAILKL